MAVTKYTKKKLEEEVEAYFASITRKVPVTELIDSGKKDDKGHVIYEKVPVKNNLGQIVTVTEYIVPPSIEDLSLFLGIHRSTWCNYCDKEKYPQFFDTTTRAQGRIRAYLVRESLTRSGKDVKGILFNLENNYGYSEKVEVSGGIEDFLSKQTGQGRGF